MLVSDSIRRSAGLRRDGAYRDAETLIEALVRDSPDESAVWDEYAKIASARHDKPTAIQRWVRAKMLAKSEDAQKRIGADLIACYLATNQLTEARSLAREVLRDGSPSLRLRQLLGILCHKESKARADPWEFYWQSRSNYIYVHACMTMMRIVGRTARSVVDVGSNRTPILDCLPHVRLRYSVDPTTPYVAPGIHSISDDFLKWDPGHEIDIGMCFQVMEHVPEVDAFARRLLELCEVVLISVPFKEEAGRTSTHIHHSIDVAKIASWFGRQPNFHYIARELSGEERIIALFDRLSPEIHTSFNAESTAALGYMFRWSLDGAGL